MNAVPYRLVQSHVYTGWLFLCGRSETDLREVAAVALTKHDPV
jgi:hypothetical protein